MNLKSLVGAYLAETGSFVWLRRRGRRTRWEMILRREFMKSTKKTNMTAAIGVACVWMGTHFGPGVGSGTQLITYYVNYGLPGIICSVLAMCILGYGLYCSVEFSRIYKTYDYGSWMQKIWGYKWVSVLFDISFIITCMTALGGSLNAIATLMNEQFGLNYWLGVVLVVIATALLCAFGAKLVTAASSYMMYAVLGVLLMILILVMVYGDTDLSGSIANQATNLPSVSWPKAVWSAIIYAAFQCTVVANISSVAMTVPNRSTSRVASIVGIIGNSAMLVIMGTMLFSYTNVFAITDEALPFYAVLNRIGFGWAKVVYVCIVFVAVLSTAVGFCFGGLARFSKFYRKPDEKTPIKDGILVACILVVCAFCSRFGIVALVSTGYTILGYINLPLLLLPAIILGGKKIKKKYLQANNIEAPGVDE